jgi:hypothetical protein
MVPPAGLVPGRPPGYVNPSPESGVAGERVVVGVMGIPAGDRRRGFHAHTVREVYVVLRGTPPSLGLGVDYVAGLLDVVDIPPARRRAWRRSGRTRSSSRSTTG